MCLDLLNLMSFLAETRSRLRAANVEHVLRYFEKLASHPKVNSAKLCIAGHSAGGAIAIESVCALLEANKSPPHSLLLLDAVPWLSTLKRADLQSSKFTVPLPINVSADHPSETVCVASLRGEPGSWNANGLILEALARSFGKGACDVKIMGARHGDFMCPEGGRFGGLMQCAMKVIGLTSNARIQDDIEALIVAFVQSSLQGSPAYAEAHSRLSKDVVIRMVDPTKVTDMRKNLPSFLR